MCNNQDHWRQSHIESLDSSLEFFGNANKLEREKFVVRRLLTGLGVEFQEEELTDADEPVDVGFRDGRFQVKELMDPERRRGDEFKESRKKAMAAENQADLLESYTPYDLPFESARQICVEKAKSLNTRYGPAERATIDLLLYFNFLDCGVIPPEEHIQIATHGFRSVSLVTNSHVIVLAAENEAPDILRQNIGSYIVSVETGANAI